MRTDLEIVALALRMAGDEIFKRQEEPVTTTYDIADILKSVADQIEWEKEHEEKVHQS